jgi:hypothetical protein
MMEKSFANELTDDGLCSIMYTKVEQVTELRVCFNF